MPLRRRRLVKRSELWGGVWGMPQRTMQSIGQIKYTKLSGYLLEGQVLPPPNISTLIVGNYKDASIYY